jgi:hypothetical protein
MENHHHEEPKPTNKWISTPILMAVIVICCVVGFLNFASGQCCGGKCDAEHKKEHNTEQHDAPHGEVKTHEVVADTTHATTDTTAVHEGHDEHAGHDHGH